METLNRARLSILLRQYLDDGRVLTPAEANRREPVFPGRSDFVVSDYLTAAEPPPWTVAGLL